MENYEASEEEVNSLIEFLIENGALEVLGFDKQSDSFTYKITDKCKELYPELYNAHFSHVGDLAMSLWQNDAIDIIFNDNGPTVGMTVEQFEYAKNNLESFNDDERLFLDAIISHYENGV